MADITSESPAEIRSECLADLPRNTQARKITFGLGDYADLDHGYAATIHKAQGVTVDRAHVLASPHMDRHAAYVALTRHRDGVALHYGRDAFADAGRLARGLAVYARTWSDAERMKEAGLPVLPHQALARAGERLEDLSTGLSRDARAALARRPALAQAIGQEAGALALDHAVDVERRGRLVLEERGRAAVREWDKLERAYETAEKAYDWQGQRAAGARLEKFAKALKADRALDGVLRDRGRELGIAAGSRLERVVQAKKAEITHELRHELGLSQGRGMSLGR